MLSGKNAYFQQVRTVFRTRKSSCSREVSRKILYKPGTVASELNLSTNDLSGIALFRHMEPADLEELKKRFYPAVTVGGVLFETGQEARSFYLLTKGEVVLYLDGEETHRLKPLVLIGELGALTGRKRNSKALCSRDTEVWAIDVGDLHGLFKSNIGFTLQFQQNLMGIVADKVARDQTRLEDMRKNLIRTQKLMKALRDYIEESPDTKISERIHGELTEAIARNRRVNYRVNPPPAMGAYFRSDSGADHLVLEISRTHLSLRWLGDLPSPSDNVSGVVTLAGPEIVVSGNVLRTVNNRVDIEMDELYENYSVELEGYLTRLQMLDFLV